MKEEKPSAALAAVTCDEKSPEATAGLALPTAQENDELWQTVNSKKKGKKGKGKERKDGLGTQTTSIPFAGAYNMEGARKVALNGQTRSQSGLMQKTCTTRHVHSKGLLNPPMLQWTKSSTCTLLKKLQGVDVSGEPREGLFVQNSSDRSSKANYSSGELRCATSLRRRITTISSDGF